MFFDTHTHTKYSCDCSKIPEDGIISAINKGLSGLAITDHSDLRLFEMFDIRNELPASARETQRLKEKYGDRIKISNGFRAAGSLPMIFEMFNAAKIVKNKKYSTIISRSMYNETI